MLRKRIWYLYPALAFVPAVGPSFGGWAVITVDDLPDYVMAGQPVRLAFTVRQHGFTLLDSLHPRVEATSGRAQRVVDATHSTGTGHYAATLTVPAPGDWTVTIHSGFGPSKVTLLPLRAIDARSSPPQPAPERERGRRLFVAKGCVTCHVHDEAKVEGTLAVGPALTARRYPGDYLARFLANPAISTTQPQRMPNLGLGQREIAALVTFLNTDRQVSTR